LTPEAPATTMSWTDRLRRAGGVLSLDVQAIEELLVNDLERAATRLCPEIGELRRRLVGAGAVAAGMSGSGPTVFGLFADEAGAERGERRFGAEAPTRTWRTRTLGAEGSAGDVAGASPNW
jgi:4-diphosphocytidyl-2C-methyl-D-erythritol kinase